MNITQAIILGLIQGITEFLPVSSSGHLVLLQKIFNIKESGLVFDVILHIGTLIPVVIIFWDMILKLIIKPWQKYMGLIIVSTIPAVIVALLFGEQIELLFSSGKLLCFGFCITGVFLLIADKNLNKSTQNKLDHEILYKDAIKIGAAQAVAIMPGVSRSGSSISASLLCGLNKDTAAKFSFVLSVPVIIGAAVLESKHVINNSSFILENFVPVIFGFISAVISGYISIRFMLKFIREKKLRYFAYYVFVLSGLIFLDQFCLKIFF